MSLLKRVFLLFTAGVLALMVSSPLFPVRAGFLDLFSSGPVAPTTETLKWQFTIDPEDRLYPSYIIAASTRAPIGTEPPSPDEMASGEVLIGEREGSISVTFTPPVASLPVRIVITSKTIMDESVLETTLGKPLQSVRLRPKILWNYSSLMEIRQVVPVDITAELFINGRSFGRQTRTVKLHTINDCPFSFEEAGEFKDTWWMYAAYVNENHPLVDRFLKEVFAQKIVTQFDGYQSGDPKEVYRQVYAIWHLLYTKGFHYSSLTGSSDNAEKVGSQFVRFLDESMNLSQANCVDGSVLFASVLRKIGIDPFLVMTPDHMWVGFYLDEDHATKRYLETTLLGGVGEDAEAVDNELYHFFGEEYTEKKSWQNFISAIRSGRDGYGESRVQFESGETNYGVVDIDEARSMGVIPIAFTRPKNDR